MIDGQVTPHFAWKEFYVHSDEQGDPPADALANVPALAAILEEIRVALGVPIFVTSFWRSAARNAEVGGVSHSEHIAGRAVDGKAFGATLARVASIVEQLRQQGLTYGQFIVYADQGHFHVSLPRDDGRENNENLYSVGGTPREYTRYQAAADLPARFGVVGEAGHALVALLGVALSLRLFS